MNEAQQSAPPKLRRTPEGRIEDNSLADMLEWFLANDHKVVHMRRQQVQELFEWKQQDDKVNGANPAPFESAEARFAVGIFLALQENDSQPLLQMWITDVLEALGAARENNENIARSYKLATDQGRSAVTEANNIPSNTEKRLYLSSCWLEALCTAEARVLGWVYQEIYGMPYQPAG
jgi:hypothetical protein